MVLRDDQIQRLAALGVVASIQFTWLTSDWLVLDDLRTVEATLGPDRIGWAGRWRDLLDAGVRVAGGTDTPWTRATPLQAIHQAVTRVGISERPAAAEWMVRQAITVEEALRLLTIDAAYATSQEHIKGSIQPGRLADLVVLKAGGENIGGTVTERVGDQHDRPEVSLADHVARVRIGNREARRERGTGAERLPHRRCPR